MQTTQTTKNMPTIPDDIIIRSLLLTATAQESERLNKWLKEDKRNAEYYFQLEEIWYSHEGSSAEAIRQGWEKLSCEIETLPRTCSLPRKHSPLRWLRYAAAVSIGVLIASAVWINRPFNTRTESSQTVVQNIVYNHSGVQPITLPDNSQVWLNEGSKIVYPNQFDGKQRMVSLEGKAYFDIHKNPDKPFVVQIGKVLVEVTGTEFFVESASEEETFVTLVSGSVRLNYTNKNGKNLSARLLPGQQAGIDPLNCDMEITDVDTSYYTEWKDGVYSFVDEPLEKIAGLVAKRYDLELYVAKSLRKKRFTGRVASDEDIEKLLITMGKSYPISYSIIGNKVNVYERK
jgi:ferric-dicitrate binding protein FerR (iron transport regulator)